MRQLNKTQIRNWNRVELWVVALCPFAWVLVIVVVVFFGLFACEFQVFNAYDCIRDVNVKRCHHKHCHHAFVYVNKQSSRVVCFACVSFVVLNVWALTYDGIYSVFGWFGFSLGRTINKIVVRLSRSVYQQKIQCISHLKWPNYRLIFVSKCCYSFIVISFVLPLLS